MRQELPESPANTWRGPSQTVFTSHLRTSGCIRAIKEEDYGFLVCCTRFISTKSLQVLLHRPLKQRNKWAVFTLCLGEVSLSLPVRNSCQLQRRGCCKAQEDLCSHSKERFVTLQTWENLNAPQRGPRACRHDAPRLFRLH